MIVQWDGDEPYLVVTNDTRITPHRATDIDDLVELNNTPDIARDNLLGQTPYTREDAQEWLNFLEKDHECVKAMKDWPVHGCPFRVLRNQSDKVIGTVIEEKCSAIGEIGLKKKPKPLIEYTEDPHPYPWSNEGWCIGYSIHPEYTGRGLGKQMINKIVEWAGSNEGMGLRHIGARTGAYNKRSQHILLSIGFREVARASFKVKSKDGTEYELDDVAFAMEL